MSEAEAHACVKSQAVAVPSEGDLAVAHTNFNGQPGTHCGIFFATRDKEMKLLHLALHLCLVEDSVVSPAYGFVSSDLVRTQRRQISKLCRLILTKRGSNVPYGFKFGFAINSDGSLPQTQPGDGFTCTTFVLAIFANANVFPIDASTWPVGVNQEWQGHIIEAIAHFAHKFGFSADEHLAALKEQGDAIRVTPQELAAALCSDLHKYQELTQLAVEIVGYLRNNFEVLGQAGGGAAA